jgi:hypothetical protein
MGRRFEFHSEWGDVCFGSKADFAEDLRHVRFTPVSGHWVLPFECPRVEQDRGRFFRSPYSQALEEFSEKELAQLTLSIVAINGWNRFNVAFRTPAGNYKSAIKQSAA